MTHIFTFEVNDRVKCRDQGKTMIEGVVKTIEPLTVQVEGWPVALEFEEVFPAEELETKPVTLKVRHWQKRFLCRNNGAPLRNFRSLTGASIVYNSNYRKGEQIYSWQVPRDGWIRIEGTKNKQEKAVKMIREFLSLKPVRLAMLQADYQKGMIIGKNGNTLSQIETETGAMLEKDSSGTLWCLGTEASKIAAQRKIQKIIACRVLQAVTDRERGAIIGHGGKNIKKIQKQSGVTKIFFCKNKKSDFRREKGLLQIEGDEAAVRTACALVHKAACNTDLWKAGGGWSRGKQLSWYIKKDRANWFDLAKHNKQKHGIKSKKKKQESKRQQLRQKSAHKQMRRVNKKYTVVNFSVGA